MHPDLIAIIKERYPGHSEDHPVGQAYLTRCQAGCNTRGVMVAGQEAEAAEQV